MAGYQRKELQILGGGFNLLPPGDKTPKTDYLLAQNWRVDRAGKLVSRYGYPLKFQIGDSGAPIAHSAAVFGGVEGGYYVGASRGSGGAVYYKLLTSAIASGFDANRIGMVPMNGWMWIMNRGQVGRHNNDSGFQNWGNLAPPTEGLTPFTAAVGAADATGPSGTYEFYVTFVAPDQSLESNPSPVSLPARGIALSYQDAILTGIPTSPGLYRNIYATGGTLGQAYLVGSINDATTTVATFNATDCAANAGPAPLDPWNDLSATNNGVVMPTDNDPPPLAAGMVGPYFARLIAWSTAANVNRMFWTNPATPQYWPGAADPAVGNWVDVGMDGEQIVWCTMHTNVLVIYKERSIWRLVGDPDTGYIEQVVDGLGLVNAFAVAPAGPVDYFVGPNGFYLNTLDSIQDLSGAVRPLFDTNLWNSGPLTPPGSILPGTGFSESFSDNSLHCYAVALGYAMGKVYLAYSEQTTTTPNNVLLVYHEGERKWMYHRDSNGTVGFRGFFFDGVEMVGLTGDSAGTSALGYNLDDFLGRWGQDDGAAHVHAPIECVYASHYEDAGLPDNQKCWLEVVVDIELSGDSAQVCVAYDNGAVALAQVGAPITAGSSGTSSKRVAVSFALGTDGTLAKNIQIAIACAANWQVAIHNVYLYYYEEARLAAAASTLPTDLGSAKVKQCKELQLDINPSGGAVAVNLYSDLPGNQLAVRQTPSVATAAGRAVWKYPFPVTEGFLWRLALTAAAGPFRLYSARLLMRVVGVYVEAYEAAGGFVWDSMEHTFDSGITHITKAFQIALAMLPIKRFREITLVIETFNANVTVKLLTDLPGNAQAVRFTGTANTGMAGRRFVRLPLPAGTAAPIEGRMCRLQLSGSAKFILYEAAVETLAVGVYVEAYEAAGGAVYDSREMDFGTPAMKEARELELDLEMTTGNLTVALLSDWTGPITQTIAAPAGRQKVMLPLNVNVALEQFMEGRLLRLILSGTQSFRLYGARIRVRPFGQYLLGNEAQAGVLWDSTDLDLGSQAVKQLRELDLDIWAYDAYTVTVYTDLPGNAMVSRVVSGQFSTNGRRKVRIPLPQGSVPDNYIFGRLLRVTITSAASVKLFGARIDARAIGVYVESYEALGGAVWDSTPSDLGSPSDKSFDQVRFEMDSDGAAWAAVYTDLPGEAFASRGSFVLTSGPTSRHWATVPLPVGIEGRSVRLVVTSGAGFRIYKAQVRAAQVGRYLCAQAPAGNDALTTLEFDFRSERRKLYKKIEVDLRADSPVTLVVLTEQSGQIAQVYTQLLYTPAGRAPLNVVLPPGIRGRLLRVALTGGPARVYHIRVWTRPVNEPGAKWDWEEYPLEQSDVLPKWADLPVEPTAPTFSWADLPVTPTQPEWAWAPFPVNPTEAQWFWAKVLSVEETPDVWQWVDVPFEVTG